MWAMFDKVEKPNYIQNDKTSIFKESFKNVFRTRLFLH